MKKLMIVLIILYLAISVIFTFIFNNKKIVYIGDYTKIYINDNKILKKNTNTLSNIEVKYYFNGQLKNGYLFSEKLDYDNTNYLKVVSENNEKIQFNDGLIAMTKDVNIDIIEPKQSNVSSDEIDNIKNYLVKNNMNYDLKELYKYSFDIDKNGIIDEIYSSNLHVDEEHNLFVILIKTNNDIQTIDSSLFESGAPNSRKISLFKFIKFDDNQKYNIIIKEDNGDDQPTYYNVYSYDNGKLNQIKEE